MSKITKSLLLAAMALFTANNYAQVGIGTTTPDNSASLEVLSTNTGILLPRVALTNVTNGTTPVNTPATSLLVYNTNAGITGGSGTGYYFWDGSEWVKLETRPSSDWTLLGNTGTNANVNFLGTIDAIDLVFRSNNTERIRVASDGKVGIGENNPTDAVLEVGGNLIVGDTFTGGTAVAQQGGVTIEGRTIIGEDDFNYSVDKFVVYGNTTWIAGSATNGDNGNGLPYAINAYTSAGFGLYAEDNDGGIGVQVAVDDLAVATAPIGVDATDYSGIGTAVRGESENATVTGIGVLGLETTNTGWAVAASGDMIVTGFFSNPSDKKLKENIQPLTGALTIIDDLNPKTYNMRWNEDKYKKVGFSKTPQLGFIAQEIEAVLPNLVKTGKIPLNNHKYTKEEIAKNPDLATKRSDYEEIKSVNYIQMIPLLTQAIKEQQEQIRELQTKISQLENN